MEGEKYVSMFKINGVPILPPLMTAARRREMLAYKELAVALETRLKLEASERNARLLHGQDMESISSIEDEYLKVSSMLQDQFSPTKLPQRTVANRENPSDMLKKSDTFIYDINTNTVMIQGDKEVLAACKSNNQNDPGLRNMKFSKICQIETKSNQQTPAFRISPKAENIAGHVAPSISIEPPTPEPKECPSEETSNFSVTPPRKSPEPKQNTQRASTSPSLKETPRAQPLLRSNSFTLDCPSPVLLEHMIRNQATAKCAHENAQNEARKTPTIEIPKQPRPKTTECIVSVISPKVSPMARPKVHNTSTPIGPSESAKQGTVLNTNSAMFKSKKSPYEVKITPKPKMLKKHKTATKKVSAIALKPRVSVSHHRSKHVLTGNPTAKSVQGKDTIRRSPLVPAAPRASVDLVAEKIRDIEELHRLKLMELMQRQQDEQRQMQEQFERQQKQLLNEFNASLKALKALSAATEDGIVDVSNMPVDHRNDTNNNSNDTEKEPKVLINDSQSLDMTKTLASPRSDSKYTPRCSRRLFTGSNLLTPPTPRQKGVFVPRAATVREVTRIPSPSKRKVEQAATIINAYARGFLIRRLFRTEHVQNIVQTIRDTLLFVLDFHRETENDMSEDNILFKARLLQQLTSACHALQDVFKLPTKERMKIIARDRIHMQNKGKDWRSCIQKSNRALS